MKLRKVTVDGEMYLATLVRSQDSQEIVGLKNSFLAQSATRMCEDYVKAKNLGALTDLELYGSTATILVSKLTKSEKVALKIAKMNMKLAKSTTLASLENSEMPVGKF